MNSRTEVMAQVDARRYDREFIDRIDRNVQAHAPVLDRLARLETTEETPLFQVTAGDHLEHMLQLLTTKPPTAEEILTAHPRAGATDGS